MRSSDKSELSDIWHAPGRTAADFTAEQDAAAGGRKARKVRLRDGGEALASIRLQRVGRKNKVYAYFRYRVGDRTRTHYVGEATTSTRRQALRKAWRVARTKGLLHEGGD